MKKISLLFIISLISCSVFATHNRSGEIIYKRIAPFTTVVANVTVPVYNYSITVIRYTDHGPVVADRCVDTVYFGDGQKGIAQRANGTSTCGCTGGCGQIIANSAGYIVKKNIYSITHTYPGAGTYLVYSSDPFRNAGIHNIPNSGQVSFYLEALIVINQTLGINSSPEFGFDPTNQATLGICFYENPGMTDADGDSLSYELINCLGGNGASIPGYFYPEIPVNGTLNIDPSGTFTWCDPIVIAVYQIAYRVREWRKNTSGNYILNGAVMRDREIIVNWGPVGLNETESPAEFTLAPNPAKDRVQLSSASGKNFSYVLYDVLGNLILHENKVEAEQSLEINTLTTGIYFLTIEQEGRQLNLKLIKE